MSREAVLTVSNPAGAERDAQEPSQQRRVFDMAWPVISENFLQTMLGITDTLLVAQLGAAAIAGVGTALQIQFLLIAALSALSVGSAVLVAQAIGAGDAGQASFLTRQSLVWSVCLSIPLAVVGLAFSGEMMSIFGLEPEVHRIGTEYMEVTMGTVVVLVLFFIGAGAMRGAGDSRTPMQVTAIVNVLNVGLSYVLITGLWFFPEMGAVGSAWATFACRLLAVILLIRAMWRGSRGFSIRLGGSWLPNWQIARKVLGLGIPAALEQLLIACGFLVLNIVVAGLGTATLAAHRIAFNALSLSFLPGIGFGVAATALVGQSYGARKLGEGRDVARIASIWALGWMSVMGALLYMLAPQIIRLFSADAEMIRIGSTGLRVLAFTQPFWAILFVQSGSLRGLGNTRVPLTTNATGIWTSVVLGYLFVQFWGGGLGAVWAAFLITAPVTSGVLWICFGREIQRLMANSQGHEGRQST